MAKKSKAQSKIDKLIELLHQKKQLLIIMQDNPDPDSIASAVALRKLANSVAETACSITYGGTVGRGENRALVRYLGVNLHKCEDVAFEKFDLVALVDTQPGTGNNWLPTDIVPDIVIDHHPVREATRRAKFYDIRSKYGATSTILLEYLTAAGITPDVQLATAILYGIRSDTQDLGRKARKADIDAIGCLFPLANKRMLSAIQRGAVGREYFQMLAAGLRDACAYENCIIAGLGEVDNPDMIAEVADLLLRDDQANCTVCYGFAQDKMLLSVRSNEPQVRADRIIRRIVARRGTAGGHPNYAGGQIPLRQGTKTKIARLEKAIRQKALRVLGVHEQKGEKLVHD
jgi:nanoRNase/pAp phosphatase (c-di-AMP/oligoRNAs hydrolase)